MLAAFTVAALAGFGCSGREDRGSDPAPVPPAFASVHSALCDSLRAAEAGDGVTAEARFVDAHGGLHDLAAALEDEDRALAARLLEAKEKVEGAGAGPEDRRLLTTIVAESIEAVGGAAPEAEGCSG